MSRFTPKKGFVLREDAQVVLKTNGISVRHRSMMDTNTGFPGQAGRGTGCRPGGTPHSGVRFWEN
jgi:hypothetical protein